jgi:hypothetical protein
MVQETANQLNTETSKIRKQFLTEVKEIVKTKSTAISKKIKIQELLKGKKGISYRFAGDTLYIKSEGEYATTYEYKL